MGRVPGVFSWRAVHHRRLVITVDKCCEWLQQLPHEDSNMSC